MWEPWGKTYMLWNILPDMAQMNLTARVSGLRVNAEVLPKI
jgi:hypothetical protein